LSKKYILGETKQQRKLRKKLDKNKSATISVAAPPVITSANYQKPAVNNTFNKVAFVLGNGNSRSEIDPLNLKRYGKIYGCNALYRTFSPDFLVAVDTKMIKEITTAGYHNANEVWTNPNRYTREIANLKLFNPNLGWSSGPSALTLASSHSYDIIYILGFDYVGSGKNNDLVNNVYAGTHNYKQLTEKSTYYGNWQRQTATCIKKHTKVKYIRVIDTSSSYVPEGLIGLSNLTHFTVEDFKNRFSI
jgi:hypothetical protein